MRCNAVLLGALLFLVGCRQSVIHDLNESDATTLLARLQSGNLSAEKERQPDGRWTLTVASGDAVRAIQIIDGSRMLKVLDAPRLDRSSLTSSREDQRFHYERALSREIEKTLLSLRGVLEAKVHLNLPGQEYGFRKERTSNASGSVLLVSAAEFSTSDQQIASLVSGASGVPADRISVLITPTHQQERSTTTEASTAVTAPHSPPKSEEAVSDTGPKSPIQREETAIESEVTAAFPSLSVVAAGMITLVGLSLTFYFTRKTWGGRLTNA